MSYVKGLVSVIIPTYKRCDMICRAIDSVINQSYHNIEVLIVDDNEPNSEDSCKLKEILQKYSMDKRIKYVGQTVHINGAVARNVGISQSKAEFIAFLDDDEEWEKDKIELQVSFLMDNPNVSGVSCLYSNYRNGVKLTTNKPYNGEHLQFKVLTGQVTIHTSTFLCRHIVIDKSRGFNPKLKRHQDIQMFVDFLNYGTIEVIIKDLVKNHIDSEINRPDVEKLIEVKKDFFTVISPTIDKYNSKDRARINNAHVFEIIYIAFKQKKVLVALKQTRQLKFSIKSIVDLNNRIKSR